MTARPRTTTLASALALALALTCALAPSRAAAYDGPTHAGLTERAALASALHKRLADRLARPLGLFERLRLKADDVELHHRLSRLDPEGGFVPDDAGANTALAWLAAGAVLEDVPAHRARNHFFDPGSGGGLEELGPSLALRTRLTDVQTGIGSLRGLFTGASFDGTGVAATAWALGPRAQNDWGLQRFLDERERAATAARPDERDDALARALLAAGALAHLIEDAGDPALVRNDFRVALEADDRAYERFVAARYGRLAIPEPSGTPVDKAHFADFLRDGAGGGLAERTQRRFFSSGTLPHSGRYALPDAHAGAGAHGWVAGDGVRHLAAWRRTHEGVQWALDDRCFADYADALLPEIGRYAAGAIDHLFRGRLDVAQDGDTLTVKLDELAVGAGTVALYGDGEADTRRKLDGRDLKTARAGDTLFTAPRPPWARRVTAVFRGFDAAGEPIVIVQETLLK
jgi:hypothetical protein